MSPGRRSPGPWRRGPSPGRRSPPRDAGPWRRPASPGDLINGILLFNRDWFERS